jgi:hypoxanthine phosphoribosyltransferase
MEDISVHDDIKSILLSKEEISAKVKELADRITKDYEDSDSLVVVCILKGASVFFADLIRKINRQVQIDFMSISSYGNSRSSSGVVQIRKDLDINIFGKDVLIVEDIMDSGQTLAYLCEMLSARDPSSLKICSLLDKPERRIADIQPDYCGFEIPDEFVVGYGLDYAEKYRNLEYIGVLKPELYTD